MPKSASRSRIPCASSLRASGELSLAFLASITIRPRAGPLQASIETTMSPVLPVAPLRSPTASATSPWPSAIASTASATSSSKVRPLALPRSRSASSSSSLSCSARIAASCFWSSAMRSSRACWVSCACRSSRTVLALKSASGLPASADENCLTRSSRDLTIASATSSRTRFCTEAVPPSENSFSNSLASWPPSSSKTSSTFVPKCSATLRAFSVNATSSSFAVFSNSVRTYSALAAACSRSRTRAPISIASPTVLAASSPACSRSRTRRAAASSSTVRSWIVRRFPADVMCGCLSGVAASMMWTAHRTGTVRRNGSPLSGGGRLAQRRKPVGREDRVHVTREAANDLLGQPAGRPSLDGRPHVVEAHEQAQARSDLEVGGVPLGSAEHALLDPPVHPLEMGRKRREIRLRGLLGDVVEPRREQHQGRRGAHREPVREAQVGALQEGADRGAVALQRRPGEPAGDGLEDFVAPLLGPLDELAAVRIGRKQRRLGLQLIERAGDGARALDPPPIDPQGGHRPPPEPDESQRNPVHSGSEVDPAIVDALVIEHQSGGERRMRSGHGEKRRHGAEPTSLATSD